MASYTKIDYRLRIAKSVERRLMCTLFQQLGVFYPIQEYQYIGFGSVSFLDFSLFHKQLGINKMISIEKEKNDHKRFEFNKPHSCIDLKFGDSNDVLPLLDVADKSIIWLDYDGKLSTPILDDISLLFNRLSSGSFFCVSYNAHQDLITDTAGKSRFQQLVDRIDTDYFPTYLNESTNLNKKGLQSVCYDIIQNLIEETLRKRKANGEDILVRQLLFCNYDDGAEMNTIGWLFYNENDLSKVETLEKEKLPFLRDAKNSFEIKIPMLTLKEMKEIESKFPDLKLCKEAYSKDKKDGFLLPSEIDNYYNIYKHFSLFAEIQL